MRGLSLAERPVEGEEGQARCSLVVDPSRKRHEHVDGQSLGGRRFRERIWCEGPYVVHGVEEHGEIGGPIQADFWWVGKL